jgi:hypothetical protein
MYTKQSGSVLGGMKGQTVQTEAEASLMLAQAQKELGPEGAAVAKVFEREAAALGEAARKASELAEKTKEIANNTKLGSAEGFNFTDKDDNKNKTLFISESEEDTRGLERVRDWTKTKGISADYSDFDEALTLETDSVDSVVQGMGEDFAIKKRQSTAMKMALNVDKGYIPPAPSDSEEGIFDLPDPARIEAAAGSATKLKEALGGEEGLKEVFGDGAKSFLQYEKSITAAKKA